MTPTEWATIIGAITAAVGGITAAIIGLIKASAEAARIRAEIEAMRAEMDKARVLDAERREENDQLLRETHHRVSPNGGGSIIDATSRLEIAVESLQSGMQRLEGYQRDTAADIRGVRRDVGRLADDARAHAAHSDAEHARIHARIDQITN